MNYFLKISLALNVVVWTLVFIQKSKLDKLKRKCDELKEQLENEDV